MLNRSLPFAVRLTLAASLLTFLGASTASAAGLVFEEIDAPNATLSTTPWDLSTGGIVGSYQGGDAVVHGFILKQNVFSHLDDPDAATTAQFEGTFPQGIDGGNVAGYFIDPQGNTHGFFYDGADFTTIDAQGGANTTSFNGISGANIVGSYANPPDYTPIAFVYNLNTETATTFADPAAQSNSTYPNAIDGANVVGYYYDGNLTAHGFLYNLSTEAFTTIDDPAASTGSANGTYAQGVSGGAVVGYYRDDERITHGFLYEDGNFTTIDDPALQNTYLTGTDGTDAVGYGYNGTGDTHGFLVALPSAVTGNTAASFTHTPSNPVVVAGANVTFGFGVSLGQPIAKLQWQVYLNGAWSNLTASFKSGSFSANFTGVNTANLTVIAPRLALNGVKFRLVASNLVGTVDSTFATLLVTVPKLQVGNISVTSQGSPVRSFSNVFYPAAKQNVVFSASASGAAGLTYQWTLNGKAIAKATSANYTVASFAAANSGNYSVVVTHPASGANITAAPVAAILYVAPSFLKSPVKLTLAEALPHFDPRPLWHDAGRGSKPSLSAGRARGA